MTTTQSGKTVRRRALAVKSAGNCRTRYESGSTLSHIPGNTGVSEGTLDFKPWLGAQETVSESHPSWKRARKSGIWRGDIGGDFYTSKRCQVGVIPDQVMNAEVVDTAAKTYVRASRRGPYVAANPSQQPLPALQIPSSNAQLDAAGATAIARCKPTNAIADGVNFLLELIREGVKSPIRLLTDMWQQKTDDALKAGADSYLSYEFGYMPIVAEVQNFARAVAMFDVATKQFERDAGRLVRRRYEFPVVSSWSSSKLGGTAGTGYAPFGHSALLVPGSADSDVQYVTKTTTVESQRWFSGAFTYYVPSSEMDTKGFADRASKIFGLELTPEVLWNAAPWTWAVDWFSNAGDVISNYSDFLVDGLLLRYGYVMERKLTNVQYTYQGPSRYRSGNLPTPITLMSETKVRRRATPFGFGTLFDGLSPRQLAITIALGITKW